MQYSVTCGLCRTVVLVTTRITDTDAATLTEHLHTKHPGVVRPESAPSFIAALRHFDVQPEEVKHGAE